MKTIMQIAVNGVAIFGLLASFAALVTGGSTAVALGVGLASLAVLALST